MNLIEACISQVRGKAEKLVRMLEFQDLPSSHLRAVTANESAEFVVAMAITKEWIHLPRKNLLSL